MAFLQRRPPIDVDSLRVRLVPHASRKASHTAAVSAGAFDLVMVEAHQPDREIALDRVDASRMDLRSLMDVAMRQTWQNELSRLDVRDHEIGGNRKVLVLAIDDNDYVTTALLAIGKFIGEAPAGAFVAAPAYDSVAAYPITSSADRDVYGGLSRIAASVAAESKRPCDPRAYWWDGRIAREVQASRLDLSEIVGPDDLLERMASLPT